MPLPLACSGFLVSCFFFLLLFFAADLAGAPTGAPGIDDRCGGVDALGTPSPCKVERITRLVSRMLHETNFYNLVAGNYLEQWRRDGTSQVGWAVGTSRLSSRFAIFSMCFSFDRLRCRRQCTHRVQSRSNRSPSNLIQLINALVVNQSSSVMPHLESIINSKARG